MLGIEEQNQKTSSLEIYSKYIVENSDTRFIKQIEAMTDKQKESWSKVELVICISVHATGDVEANIVHTIEKILLKDQTLDRSKIGIVVYANCAKVNFLIQPNLLIWAHVFLVLIGIAKIQISTFKPYLKCGKI
jgi:hypothetical protein